MATVQAPVSETPAILAAETSSPEPRSLPVQLTSPMGPSQDPSLLSQTLPAWAREVGAALATRPSRASSIISTRTRFSTTTLQDDARSVDIHLGGQYFRISRDGSRITSEAPPPPYSGLEEPEDRHEERRYGNEAMPGSRPRQRSNASLNFRSSHFSGGPRLSSLRANITDPSEIDLPSPMDGLQSVRSDNLTTQDPGGYMSVGDPTAADVPSRNPSYKSGEESITVAHTGKQTRTVSHNDLPDPSTPLRRRNGVRLPTLNTDPPHHRRRDKPSPFSTELTPTSGSSRHQHSRSAGPVLLTEQHDFAIPRSPTFIGRQATGVFPVSQTDGTPGNAGRIAGDGVQPATHAMEGHTIDGAGRDGDEENSISLHYTQMIRFIDHDHRRALHQKDKELADLRERINEVDTVYRQQLRARDFIIDDLKQRLTHFEENKEAMLEKARNEVEDLWESRWKDQEFHLRERMKRIEADALTSVERMLAERKNDQAGP